MNTTHFAERSIETFLYNEAALLDEWKLEEWLGLFTQDAKYVVPTTDLPEGDPSRDLVFIDDDFVKLKGRIKRLLSHAAHREFPHSRTRRIVSNVRVTEVKDNEAQVAASFVIYRFRGGATEPFVGRYNYSLIHQDGALKIRYRRATLDLENLRGQGAVSIIL